VLPKAAAVINSLLQENGVEYGNQTQSYEIP